MTMAVSTATPASAMKPTSTATDMSYCSHHRNQTPPASATGSAVMMITTSVSRLKARNSMRAMTRSVAGATSVSRSCTRSRYSYWPDQAME